MVTGFRYEKSVPPPKSAVIANSAINFEHCIAHLFIAIAYPLRYGKSIFITVYLPIICAVSSIEFIRASTLASQLVLILSSIHVFIVSLLGDAATACVSICD